MHVGVNVPTLIWLYYYFKQRFNVECSLYVYISLQVHSTNTKYQSLSNIIIVLIIKISITSLVEMCNILGGEL